jgi:hypothetical protein
LALDLEIAAGNNRRVQAQLPKRNGFDKKRRRAFLTHLTATCNVTASAREAGVGVSTVYMRRARDEAFRAEYEAALAQGYAMLEAELARRAATALCAFEPSDEGLGQLAAMDSGTAMKLIEFHRKGLERGAGNVRPQASDVEQARARLEKKVRALGLLDFRDGRCPLCGVSGEAPSDVPAPAEEPA